MHKISLFSKYEVKAGIKDLIQSPLKSMERVPLALTGLGTAWGKSSRLECSGAIAPTFSSS